MKRKAVLATVTGLGAIVSLASCTTVYTTDSEPGAKRILYVDSYHEGYAWSDGVTKGIKDAVAGKDVALEIIRMDTKRNHSPEFKKAAALQAKSTIDEYKPHVLIASDDNASKYLVMPYYKDADISVVFCGVNWDARVYGYPYKNATGMVEISDIPQLVGYLKRFAGGNRIGYIGADVLTARKNATYYRERFGFEMSEAYAKNFQDWKSAFSALQQEVDMLLIGNTAGINAWDDEAALAYVKANTRIPTGTVHEHMSEYALIGFAKLPTEQGYWAGMTALKILGGTSPADIPVAQNEKGKLVVNRSIAETLGIQLPSDLLAEAEEILQ